MKLAHLLVAGTALVSASALAAGDQKDAQASKGASSQAASSQAASSQQHDKETVKQVQQKLSQEGIDVGPADGIMGPKTQAGLKEYQQKNQLQATGKLDQQTLAELGVEAGGSSSVGASSGGSGQPELKSRDAQTRSIGEKFPSSQGSSQGSQGQQEKPEKPEKQQ